MKVKMSVAFDSKSREVDSDDLNLIDSSYRLRRERRFQNPGKSKHFPLPLCTFAANVYSLICAVKRRKSVFMMECRLRQRLNPSNERIELN